MTGGDVFAQVGEWREQADLIGALIIPVDPDGRVLLQLRDYNTVRYPGRWGFFGGKVEKGESLREAAAREFHEESGVALNAARLIPRFRMSSPEAQSNLYVFEAAITVSPRDIRLGEGAGFAFVAPSNFARLDLAYITEIILAEWRALHQV